MHSQVAVVLAAVVVGLVVGLAFDPGDSAARIVVPALIGLLTITFAGVRREAWRRAVRPHRRVAVASLLLNFVWAPTVALVLGTTLLVDEPALRIGLVMLLVTPCTDWYLVFTRSAGGNVPLAAALLPVNLVAQMALLPVYVPVLTGAEADVPLGDLITSVLVVLGVPLVIVGAARLVAARTGRTATLESAAARLEPFGVGLLGVAIVGIFAAHATAVRDDPVAFVRIVVPVAIFFVVAYATATMVARLLGAAHAERVALTTSTMARNSPIALAVAAATFPDRPLVIVALVVGPLLELPVLALASARLARAAPA
ncbi:MAG: bile acid:sodium symporter [Ilumatobacteraceae bacterium]